jgi:hypothetical protein
VIFKSAKGGTSVAVAVPVAVDVEVAFGVAVNAFVKTGFEVAVRVSGT